MIAGAEERAPDYAEALLGWRVWDVVRSADGMRLSSIVHNTVWIPREEVVAGCRRPFALLPWSRMPLHQPPVADCVCGIYGLSTPEEAIPYLYASFDRSRPLHRVIGRVALWGRVVEGARGWRARIGYPEQLVVPTLERGGFLASVRRRSETGDRIALELCEYGVPVHVVDRVSHAALHEACATSSRAA